jgi:hypothetical protein
MCNRVNYQGIFQGSRSSFQLKEIMMIGKISLTAGLLALGVMFAPQTSTAASMSLPPGIAADSHGLVQETRMRRRCTRWHNECRARWGRGRDYRRCMSRRGC